MGTTTHTSCELGRFQTNTWSQQQYRASCHQSNKHYQKERQKMSTIEGVIRQSTDNPVEQPPHARMDRFEKMEFLKETSIIPAEQILEQMLSWMTEDQFSDFYEHFCTCWDLCRSYEELNEKHGD